MERIIITGGKPLYGEISVSGFKNAAAPIIFATILAQDKCVIENLPDISDVRVALDILTAMGAYVKYTGDTTVEIDTTNINPGGAPVELVRKMRASYYLLGAELGRFGKATVGTPGGCDLGERPIDQHIKGFEALGATVEVDESTNTIVATAPEGGRLIGDSVYLDVVTVGATINIMLAAVLAEGTTVIENAAHEPHIVDTANFLNSCGAEISGAGTDSIRIRGVKRLHGTAYAIIPDMIEAGTYMILAAATNGKLKISNLIPKHVESITAKLEEMGIIVEEGDESVTVYRGEKLNKVNIKTLPYPGFPTDMNPQICVMMCLLDNHTKCTLTEGVWENRFRYVEELKRMGACITVNGRRAEVEGVGRLHGAKVRAVDLRAGVAMVIAGLAASGQTEIDEIFHIQRGYDNIVEKLKSVGADIDLVTISDSYTKISD